MDLLYIVKPKRPCRVCATFRTIEAMQNRITADLLYGRRTPRQIAREFREAEHSGRTRLTPGLY